MQKSMFVVAALALAGTLAARSFAEEQKGQVQDPQKAEMGQKREAHKAEMKELHEKHKAEMLALVSRLKD